MTFLALEVSGNEQYPPFGVKCNLIIDAKAGFMNLFFDPA
jgi:hypothetical protein